MKTIYRIDQFVDFNGIEREFIIAAVSVDLTKEKTQYLVTTVFEDEDDYIDIHIPKVLLLGVAIRNPNDKYDEALGMKIAENRALKMLEAPEKMTGRIIAVSDRGLINTTVVSAILDQEAAYFKRDPGKYIPGYDKKAKRKV